MGAAKNRPAPAIEVVVTHEARALRRAANVRSRPMQVRRIVRRAHPPLDLKRHFRELLQSLGAPDLAVRCPRAVPRFPLSPHPPTGISIADAPCSDSVCVYVQNTGVAVTL